MSSFENLFCRKVEDHVLLELFLSHEDFQPVLYLLMVSRFLQFAKAILESESVL